MFFILRAATRDPSRGDLIDASAGSKRQVHEVQ